jgi:heme oxygenase
LNAAGEASKAYKARLEHIGSTAPHKLIAHVWVRYMGDLFGGQISKKKIECRWPNGVAFYEYEQLLRDKSLTKASMFVTPFRKILDELPLTIVQQQDIVEEAVWGFQQHLIIFEEISNPSSLRSISSFALPFLMQWNPGKLFNTQTA